MNPVKKVAVATILSSALTASLTAAPGVYTYNYDTAKSILGPGVGTALGAVPAVVLAMAKQPFTTARNLAFAEALKAQTLEQFTAELKTAAKYAQLNLVFRLALPMVGGGLAGLKSAFYNPNDAEKVENYKALGGFVLSGSILTLANIPTIKSLTRYNRYVKNAPFLFDLLNDPMFKAQFGVADWTRVAQARMHAERRTLTDERFFAPGLEAALDAAIKGWKQQPALAAAAKAKREAEKMVHKAQVGAEKAASLTEVEAERLASKAIGARKAREEAEALAHQTYADMETAAEVTEKGAEAFASKSVAGAQKAREEAEWLARNTTANAKDARKAAEKEAEKWADKAGYTIQRGRQEVVSGVERTVDSLERGAENLANKAGEKAQNVKEDAQAGADRTVASVEKGAEKLAQKVQTGAEVAVGAVAQGASKLADKTAALAKQAKEGAGELIEKAKTKIEEIADAIEKAME